MLWQALFFRPLTTGLNCCWCYKSLRRPVSVHLCSNYLLILKTNIWETFVNLHSYKTFRALTSKGPQRCNTDFETLSKKSRIIVVLYATLKANFNTSVVVNLESLPILKTRKINKWIKTPDKLVLGPLRDKRT